jgi:DNA polymerase
MPGQRKVEILAAIDEGEVRNCKQCTLCHSRTQTVFGEGDPNARLMFIGEGPGQTEDEMGRPFVGRAGELLNKMIAAMKLRRQQVYIANVVKCRPPENRTPTPAEALACFSFLRRQVLTIAPAVIVTLGGPATKTILDTQTGITALRGVWQEYRGLIPEGPVIPVMPTFHPAYLLRDYRPETRKKVWSDLQQVMARLEQLG